MYAEASQKARLEFAAGFPKLRNWFQYSMSSGRGGGGVNRVVPVAVEPMPFETHRGELRVGHGHAAGVAPAIQLRSNAEPRPQVGDLRDPR